MMVNDSNNIYRPVQSKVSFVIWFWMAVMIGFVACFYYIWIYHWNVTRLMEFQKCPACYGDSLCMLLDNEPGLLKVNYFGYFGWIANSITTKNVYQGYFNSTDIMLKCLGTESELNEMDKQLCRKLPEFCHNDIKLSVDPSNTIKKDIKNLLSDRLLMEGKVNLLRYCPSSENLDRLFKGILGGIDNDMLPLPLGKLINIWTILHVNPEPLILQIFPKKEGWPFPEYLGACGRVIFETHEGSSLAGFYDKPWEERARLALQLLKAVDKFILQSPDFSLYLLDYSPDNIAVNAQHRISFVDLEHTIIVDKYSSLFDENHDTFHQSGALCSSDDCSYFSPDDICKHQTSDFNHYMLCKEILVPSEDPYVTMPQGLLHSIPFHVRQKYPFLESALFNCSSDSKLNHILPAHVVRDVLREIVGQKL